MNAVARLTMRTTWDNRARLLMTAVAVAVSVGFMTAVLMLTGGFAGHGNSGSGAAYRTVAVVVHGSAVTTNPPGEFITESGAPLPGALVPAMRAVPGVDAVAGLQIGTATLERLDGRVIGHPSSGGGVGFNWIADPQLNPYRLVSGRPPSDAGQVVVDQAAARSGHVTLGAHLQVATVTGVHPVTVSGIATYGNALGPFYRTAVLFPTADAARLLGSEGRFDQILIAGNNPAGIVAAVTPVLTAANTHAVAETGPQWAAAQDAARTQSLSFEQILLIGFALIALVVGGTLISTTFAVTVARRGRELALTRAIGATRRQLMASVLGEAAAVGVVASLAGAAAGIGVARGMTSLFSALGLTLFRNQATITPSSLALPVVIGVTATLLAATLPAVKASSVPPVQALRAPDIDESTASRARRFTGAGLLLLAVVATAAGVAAKSALLTGLGVFAAFAGAIMFGPTLITGLALVAARPLRAAFGPSGLLAARATGRSPRRTAATANALLVGVGLVVFASSVVASVDLSTASTAVRAVHADFVLSSTATWRSQIGNAVLTRTRSDRQVRTVSPVYLGNAREGATAVVVGAIDPVTIGSVWNFGWTTGSLAAVAGDRVAVYKPDLGSAHLGDAKTLTLPDGSSQLVHIGAVYSNDLPGFNSPVYLLPPAMFHAHAAQPGAQLAFLDTTGAHRDTAGALRTAIGADDSLRITTAGSWAHQGNIKVKQLRNLFDALDALAVVLALIGILNTMTLAIHQRDREFGTMRAVGVTRAQLRRIVSIETLLMGVYGVILGAAFGLAGAWALSKSSASSDLAQFTVPVPALLISCAAGLLATVALVAWPARQAARTPSSQRSPPHDLHTMSRPANDPPAAAIALTVTNEQRTESPAQWHRRGTHRRGSLTRRLAASYTVVVLVDVVVFVLSVRFLSPLAHAAPATLGTTADVQAYQNRLDTSLLRALIIAVGISLAVGALATVLITRLMLEPLSSLRASARRLREGQYGEQIPLPRQPELTDLATDLNLLAARLADVETRRARLVSDLAHELRTPLTIIEGQLVGVADGVYDFNPELLASVREELARLRRLTEDLSGLSRAEENAYTLARSRTDVYAVTVAVADKLRPQFAARAIDLRAVDPPAIDVRAVRSASATAEVDPERVTQILANLLLNALAATPARGQVCTTVSRGIDRVTIEVSDTGRGIAAPDLDRIFERFERVAPARERPGAAGSGIGLTIARSLARAHGGTLTATSPGPGRGATFTLTLPIRPAQVPAQTGVR